jgi:transcription elongation factor Elf1
MSEDAVKEAKVIQSIPPSFNCPYCGTHNIGWAATQKMIWCSECGGPVKLVAS